MLKPLNISSFAILSGAPVLVASLAMGYFVSVKMQTNTVPRHPIEAVAATSESDTKCTPKLAIDFAAYVSDMIFDSDSDTARASHNEAAKWMMYPVGTQLDETLWNPSEKRFSNASFVPIGCFHEGIDKSGSHIVRLVGDYYDKSTGKHFVRMDCVFKIAWRDNGLRVLDLNVSPGPVEPFFIAGKAAHYKGYFEKQD